MCTLFYVILFRKGLRGAGCLCNYWPVKRVCYTTHDQENQSGCHMTTTSVLCYKRMEERED